MMKENAVSALKATGQEVFPEACIAVAGQTTMDIFSTKTSLGQWVYLTIGQEAPKCHSHARAANYPRFSL